MPVGRKYTYEPTNFYSARNWTLDMATAADRAQYQAKMAQARQQLRQLIQLLESVPRVDQFEDIPDLIKQLRIAESNYMPRK